ncbi:MAG: FG-GAP repeat protein [Planctomycetes bacterium]|nr:FG-GAP repeat protein [Planctomycetota bacterium]
MAKHLLLCVCFTLLPQALNAQSVGGETNLLFQFDGTSYRNYMGSSVANAGDVNADGIPDVIVGARGAKPFWVDYVGSAFVYSGADGSLLHQFDGTHFYQFFGNSVDGAGDVDGDGHDDLIVGAYYTDWSGLDKAGAAFVYSGATGLLLYEYYGLTDVDLMGISVAGAGDVNGDGRADFIIGANYADPGGRTEAGTASVYSGIDGSLIYQFEGPNADDHLGHSVDGAGDVNADGYADLIVGATDGFSDDGYVNVYSGQDGTVIHHIGGFFDETLGYAVSGAGDVDGDGYADFIVSDTEQNGFAGLVQVYSGKTGALHFEVDGSLVEYKLGISVSGAGDVNGDGFDDVIMGSQKGPGGRIYIYSGVDGTQLHQLVAAADYDHFGDSVSGAGDINQDGYADVIIGALNTDPSGVSDGGSAYIYAFNPYLTLSTHSVSASSGGVINLSFNFPQTAASFAYKTLISVTGTGPTTYGVDIPLTLDHVVRDSFFGNYLFPTYSDLHGTLDGNGSANGQISLPSGLPLIHVGRTFWMAAIANPSGGLPEFSSSVKAVTIEP